MVDKHQSEIFTLTSGAKQNDENQPLIATSSEQSLSVLTGLQNGRRFTIGKMLPAAHISVPGNGRFAGARPLHRLALFGTHGGKATKGDPPRTLLGEKMFTSYRAIR
ncbi:hypothetical protein CDAR_246951 [Caerostris darwini]|uniref:Ribosomal protein L2 n=1 Tax=Caerostris darwini TaxID=1538125 RepID=A0AAV4WY27_9ARAC|nr:hypothetical protein CDAR_246951 [Caerostris darwini]